MLTCPVCDAYSQDLDKLEELRAKATVEIEAGFFQSAELTIRNADELLALQRIRLAHFQDEDRELNERLIERNGASLERLSRDLENARRPQFNF